MTVGHGARDGKEAVQVTARHPGGFTASVYLATVCESYFINIGSPNLPPPLSDLPVETGQLTALVTDTRLRWRTG